MYREARVSTFWFTMKNEGLQRKARVTTFLVQKKKKTRMCTKRKDFRLFWFKNKNDHMYREARVTTSWVQKEKRGYIYRDARVSTFLRCECTFLSGAYNAHGGKDSSGGNTEF